MKGWLVCLESGVAKGAKFHSNWTDCHLRDTTRICLRSSKLIMLVVGTPTNETYFHNTR